MGVERKKVTEGPMSVRRASVRNRSFLDQGQAWWCGKKGPRGK